MYYRKSAEVIRNAALKSVDPELAVQAFLREQTIQLFGDTTVDIVAIGKAAVPMITAIYNTDTIIVQKSLIATKKNHTFGLKTTNDSELYESDHPVPSMASVESGTHVLSFLDRSNAENILFLISGGGSSLVTVPYPGISLSDIQETTKILLACGATITEINTIRKHVDKVKGGGLLRVLDKKTRTTTLVLSDVIGDDLSVIASGPTYWDTTTFTDAMNILTKYEISANVPVSVTTHLNDGISGRVPETVKPRDPIFARATHHIVGNLSIAMEAAKLSAEQLGYKTLVLTTSQQGEAKEVGRTFIQQVQKLRSQHTNTPLCILMGGETTVTLGNHLFGKGGRNQEMVLAAGIELGNTHDMYICSFGTDGIDGPTDSAGAYWDATIKKNAEQRDLDPNRYLEHHDSYTFFKNTDGLIKTGPTGTNVGDITLALC